MTELTIVLPVQNVAASIDAQLRTLLEVISALTTQFEIVVVDDASNDITSELVAEFCNEFPQIQMRRHFESRGLYSSIRTGCRIAKSKRVFVQTTDQPVCPTAIAQFWNSSAPNNLLEISDRRPLQTVDDQLIGRLSAWCDALKKEKIEREEAARAEVDPFEADRKELDGQEIDRVQRLDQAEEPAKAQIPRIFGAPPADFGNILKDMAGPNSIAGE